MLSAEDQFGMAVGLDLELSDRLARRAQISKGDVEIAIHAYEDALAAGLSGEQAAIAYCDMGYWLNLLSGASNESGPLQKYGAEAAPFAARAMTAYETGLALDAKNPPSYFEETQDQNRHFAGAAGIQRCWVFNSMSMTPEAGYSYQADIRYLEKKILPLASHLPFRNPFWMVAGRLGELYHVATEITNDRADFENAIKWFDYALGNAGVDRPDRGEVIAVWKDRRMEMVTRLRRR